jgi:hypothetical protein
MPVIPSDTSNFPTAQGSNNPEDNSSKGSEREQKKATAFDHISKGPQIPDSEDTFTKTTLYSVLIAI